MSTPTQKKKARESITAYCKAARANEPKIHYSQARPFPFVDDIAHGWHTLDCSGFVVNCYWNAMHDTAVYLPDPSGQKYSGYGNTFSMETWLRANGKRITSQPYLVGDTAIFKHYDPVRQEWVGHTMVCHVRSTGGAALAWTSHGSEGGPGLRSLNYRTDLIGVWRHPGLL